METPVVTYDYHEMVYRMMQPVLKYMEESILNPLKALGDMVGLRPRWKLREQPKTCLGYCIVFCRLQKLRFDFPCDVNKALKELENVVVYSVSPMRRGVMQCMDPDRRMGPADWVNYRIEVPSGTFLCNLVSNGSQYVKIESNDMRIDSQLIEKVLAAPALADMVNVEGFQYSHLNPIYMLLHGLVGPHNNVDRSWVFNVIVYSIQMSLLSKRHEDRYGVVHITERPTYPFFAFVMSFVAKHPNFFRLAKFFVEPNAQPATICIKASVHLQHGVVMDEENQPIPECEGIAQWRAGCYRHYVLDLIRRHSP